MTSGWYVLRIGTSTGAVPTPVSWQAKHYFAEDVTAEYTVTEEKSHSAKIRIVRKWELTAHQAVDTQVGRLNGPRYSSRTGCKAAISSILPRKPARYKGGGFLQGAC